MGVRVRVCICRHHADLLDRNLCNRCHSRSVRRGVVGVRRPRHNRAKDHQLLSQGNGVATFLAAAAAGCQDYCCGSKHRNHTTTHEQRAKARDGARASLGRLCSLALSLEQKCGFLVVCGSCVVCDLGVCGRCRSEPRGVVAQVSAGRRKLFRGAGKWTKGQGHAQVRDLPLHAFYETPLFTLRLFSRAPVPL